jgi:glycopeptide antibiotics resistance protein
MKHNILKKAIAFISALAFWLSMHFVIYGSTYSSLVMLIGHDTMQNKLIVEGFLLLLSCALCVNVYQVLANRLFIPFLRVEAIAYFVLFFAVIMLKSRGTQEINLDFFDLYTSIIEYPASVVINLLFFIPVGAVIFRYIKSTPKAFVLALAFIVTIEVLQYLLHLGIADVADIVVDMTGFAIGFLVLGILKDAGFYIVHEDKSYARIAYSQKRDSDDTGVAAGKNERLAHRIIITCTFFAVLILGAGLGFIFYDYEEYVPVELSYTTTDKTLGNLPLRSHSNDEVRRIVDSMAGFTVDGLESSTDWIEISAAGTLKMRGIVSNYESWTTESGVQCYGVSVGIWEQIGGITVTHGVPLIVTPETKVFLSGSESSLADFAKNILPLSFQYELDAECSLQDGWFKAEVLTFQPRKEDGEVPYVWFGFSDFTRNAGKARDFNKEHIFEFYSNQSSTINGYVDVLHENPDSTDYFTLRIDERIADFLICHTIDIEFKNEVPDSFFEKLSKSDNLVSCKAYLENGSIVYAG